MFLTKTIEKNKRLIDVAISLHTQGLIEPDTYVIDVDQTLQNAKAILDRANEIGITLFFMMKQLGRNPYIAKKLIEIGYHSAVVVDYREAQVMMDNNIPLGNVGHLVQIPKFQLERILKYGTEVVTVFSLDKLKEINEICKKIGKIQNVIVKVIDDGDMIYPGQDGGIKLEELEKFVNSARQLPNIKLVGVTVFPAFLFDTKDEELSFTHNYETGMKAVDLLNRLGCPVTHVNMPSTTSSLTLKKMVGTPITHGEPGHGLTGTTPIHASIDCIEIPSIVYVSEISHCVNERSYCYGGGYYRRSHLKHALINDEIVETYPVQPENIDYYLGVHGSHPVSSTVVMAFRFQIFVTRSKVVLVENIKSSNPKIVGIYDSQGRLVNHE